jgi:Rrf2 family protein
MKISAKCDYACRALLELSLNYEGGKPLQLHEIAQKQDIPLKFLSQILLELKRAGWVKSIRGKKGGYLLNKPLNKLTMGEVIRKMEGSLLDVKCINGKNRCSLEGNCELKLLWEEVKNAISNIVDSITFQDICNKVEELRNIIIYQI